MTNKKTETDINPEPPNLVKNIKWFLVHGRKNWKIVIIAILVLLAVPTYTLIENAYKKPKSPTLLGEFNITFVNHLNKDIRISSPGEFYLHAPQTPGNNQEVSAGLIGLEIPSNEYSVKVGPAQSVTVPALLLNESRLLQYLDAGEYFGVLVFSASPKPTHTEILYNRTTFEKGITVIIDSMEHKKTRINAK